MEPAPGLVLPSLAYVRQQPPGSALVCEASHTKQRFGTERVPEERVREAARIMADFYQLCVRSIEGACLSCRVVGLATCDGHRLYSSRTLALGFLWDTTDWFWWNEHHGFSGDYVKEQLEAAARSTPLGRVLADCDLFSSPEPKWNRARVDRLITCVGIVNRSNWDQVPEDNTPLEQYPQATYLISVADSRWLEHLAPGMEWKSRVWDQDRCIKYPRAWRTSDVLTLSRGIDADLAFDRLPILADALQDAGCDEEQLLSHCRSPGPHVRGCWAIDFLLGRE